MKAVKISPFHRESRAVAIGLVITSTVLPASAESIYWDGSAASPGDWNTAANWSIAAGVATSKPGSADDVIFNITGVSTAQTIHLNATAQAVNSMTFNSTGTTAIDRDIPLTATTTTNFTLGSGGITVASGAGAVRIGGLQDGAGPPADTNRVAVVLAGSTSITHNGNSSLTFGRQMTTAQNLGAITLTLNGSGSGVTEFGGGLTQNAGTSNPTALSLNVNTTGGGIAYFRSAGTIASFTLTQGIVAARGSSILGASTPMTFSGGTFGSVGSDRSYGGNVTINGNFTLGGVSVPAVGNVVAVSSRSSTFNGPVNLANGTRTITLGGNSNAFAGQISNGGLTISASGGSRTLALTGTSTYAGGTTINSNATLRLGHVTDTLKDDGTINVNGGTLNVDNPDTVGAVTLTSGTISGDSVLTGSSYDLHSGTVSTGLAGSGVALTKTTGGTVTLSGANSYTGSTLVSAGTLLVNGSLGNTAVTVSSGAAIGGSGSLNGSLGLESGAFLDVTGATLGSTSTGILTAVSTITLTNFGFSSIIGWDYTTAANGTYTLINGGSSITLGGTTPTISNPFDLGGGRQGYFQAGSLQAVIIPEPRAALLGSIGMLMLLRRRRA